ncbi:MAG: hypothetical protein ABW321_17430 [Polyangiales bacterium]
MRVFSIILGICLATSAACGSEPQQTPLRGAAGNGSAPVGIPNNADGSLSSCTQLNQTRACTCGSMPGRQVCDGAAWQTCECAAPGGSGSNGLTLDGNNRTDLQFVWEKTATSEDLGGCLPGKYEGTFGGIYWSYIATLAPISELAVPIANLDIPGEPSGFHFTVEPAQGGETILKIKGEMVGTADLVFPFDADLEGELDCKTKTFQARMINGVYSVLIEGLVAQQFVGVLNGSYDVRTQTFINGQWDVWETSGMPPGRQAPMLPREFARDGFGGFGTWSAALPTDLSSPQLTGCPTDYACGSGPLGPNKYLCQSLLGVPGCTTDAECDLHFPGDSVKCLQTSLFATCLKECKP